MFQNFERYHFCHTVMVYCIFSFGVGGAVGEGGINFVCCSTRCFVAQMETMTAGTVSILHLDTNLPQSHHHHQICTRPMGFEHQSTLQSLHPAISINEHHRINKSETKILKNRFISDSRKIGNFEKKIVFMKHDGRDI